MVSDVTCAHGTLLAAWCGQCAIEWVPETDQAQASDGDERAQSAA